MGYTHDTSMVAFIPPTLSNPSAGTWTTAMASNVVSYNHTAAADSPNIFVPILIGSNLAAFKGFRLKSIDMNYAVATAALTSVTTVELEKQVLSANGSAVTASAVAITLDSNHDTSAKRYAIGSHTMTLTVNSPLWSGQTDAFWLYVTFACAGTSVLSLYGYRAYYDLRV